VVQVEVVEQALAEQARAIMLLLEEALLQILVLVLAEEMETQQHLAVTAVQELL
jgi:hypothetical protein